MFPKRISLFMLGTALMVLYVMFTDMMSYVQRVDERDWKSLQVERRVEATVTQKYQDLSEWGKPEHYLHLQWRDLNVKIRVPSEEYHTAVLNEPHEMRCYDKYLAFNCTYPAYFDNGPEVWFKLMIPFWIGVFLLLVVIVLLITSLYRQYLFERHGIMNVESTLGRSMNVATMEEACRGTHVDKPMSAMDVAQSINTLHSSEDKTNG